MTVAQILEDESRRMGRVCSLVDAVALDALQLVVYDVEPVRVYEDVYSYERRFALVQEPDPIRELTGVLNGGIVWHKFHRKGEDGAG